MKKSEVTQATMLLKEAKIGAIHSSKLKFQTITTIGRVHLENGKRLEAI